MMFLRSAIEILIGVIFNLFNLGGRVVILTMLIISDHEALSFSFRYFRVLSKLVTFIKLFHRDLIFWA